MRLLKLTTAQMMVQRTGLPFYDAARVIGVAQLFFGTSSATVREMGFGWQIEGVFSDDAELASRRLWMTYAFSSKQRVPIIAWEKPISIKGAKRPEGTPALTEKTKLQEQWSQIKQYFGSPLTASTFHNTSATGLADSGLQKGLRGFDPIIYSHFASMQGRSPEFPEPDILAAIIGASHAAKVKIEPQGTLYLLPVFGDVNKEQHGSHPVITARYWNFGKLFSHKGGEQLASVWAMISMLDTLLDANLPVKDFAYNYLKYRGPYHSGTLGAERLCLYWHTGCDDALRQIGMFLRETRGKGVQGVSLALARALADFASNPNAQSLERVVRLKARAMADDKNPRGFLARLLFQNADTLREIATMIDTEIPRLPTNLCDAVQQALQPNKKDNKGWISGYMKLENASTPQRFVEEAQRLVSRAKIDRPIYYNPDDDEIPLTEYINLLAPSPQKFRAFRAAFLLRILQRSEKTNIPLQADAIPVLDDVETNDEDANADTEADEETE